MPHVIMHNGHQRSLFGKHVESHSGTLPTLTLYGLACLRVAVALAIEVCEQTGRHVICYLFFVLIQFLSMWIYIHTYTRQTHDYKVNMCRLYNNNILY